VTYNDEISCAHPVEGLDITGSVQAAELYALLRKIQKEEIEITVTENEVLLKAGKVRAGLTLHKEIKLPLEELGRPEKYKKLPEGFYKAMKFAMSACSTNSSDGKMVCVHVNQEGFVEGSDNFRVAHFTLEGKMPVETFLIPATSVRELLKLEPERIALGNGWVHFKTAGGTEISCRVFEDIYPDTKPFLKVEGTKITLPNTIIQVLDRASVFAKRDNSTEEFVTITLDPKRSEIKSQSEAGWSKERIDVVFEGDPIAIFITPSLLKDILGETQECVYNERVLKFEGEGWVYIVALRKQ
jgi:DNA polymerase III sliding clamp (beta) subunit (PCNA family)